MGLSAGQIASIVQGAAGGAQTAYGLWLTQKAKKSLKELQKQEMPTYGVSPELRAAYEAQGKLAEEGYTPEEEAAYRQQIERMNTAKYNQALMAGGGTMAGAVGAGIQYGNIGAETKLFESESALKRDALGNQGTIAGQLQQIRTLQDQANLDRRLNLEEAYGAAIMQGRATQMQGFNTQMESISSFAAATENKYGGGGEEEEKEDKKKKKKDDGGGNKKTKELGGLGSGKAGGSFGGGQMPGYNPDGTSNGSFGGGGGSYGGGGGQ